MKQIIFTLLFIPTIAFGQKFTVTPDGLRDSINVDKTFLVIDFEGKSSIELYEKSIQYVKEYWQDPEESIKSTTEGEYLRFTTFVPVLLRYNNSGAKIDISAKFDTELRFKDGRIRYEILNLNMKGSSYDVVFSGSKWSGYPIYEKNGKLFKAETKKDIEDYFNLQVFSLINYINGVHKDEDW